VIDEHMMFGLAVMAAGQRDVESHGRWRYGKYRQQARAQVDPLVVLKLLPFSPG